MGMNVAQLRYCLKHLPMDKSILIVSPHGKGKSTIVKDYTLEELMGFVDIRLSQYDPGDVKGLPFIDQENKTHNYTKPYWFPRDPVSRGILLLDEINRARRETKQSIFEMCLDRSLDQEKIPDGWRVVAAMNAEEVYDVEELGIALYDRWFVIEFDPTVEDWLDWAKRSDIIPQVISFIENYPNMLDPDLDIIEVGKVFPSRRSWHALSDTIKAMDLIADDHDFFIEVIKGWVGPTAAAAFYRHYVENMDIVKPIDVVMSFDSIKPKLDKLLVEMPTLISLSNSVVEYMDEAEGNERAYENLKKFFLFLPLEVCSNLWISILDNGSLKEAIVEDWQEDPKVKERLMDMYVSS